MIEGVGMGARFFVVVVFTDPRLLFCLITVGRSCGRILVAMVATVTPGSSV